MIYSSFAFIFLFLPVVLIGYFALQNLKNPLWQRIFLIIASLFFYSYNNIKYLPLILSSVVVNYFVGYLIEKFLSKNPLVSRIWLTVGICFNIALLGYYKYYDFFIENLNYIAKTDFLLKNLLLPLGISFFTFQQLSFLISIYKKEEKLDGFFNYAIFVTFFPQLVAGPIVLYDEIIPQFRDEAKRKFNASNFASGLYMFSIGMFKKAVIADTVALFVDNGFGMANLSLAAGWVTSLSYTLQIYFDFSGYSDMAIGLGKMFNIDITYNFLSPYKAESATVFWRRWHITLGRALSSYIYKPLGGNRKGITRTCINLFLTFLVSGIWHGADWTFIIWGCAYGIIVLIERLFKKQLEFVPHKIRVFLTFMTVNALWVLFRAESFGEAITVYKGMLNFGNIGLSQVASIALDGLINFPSIIDYLYVFGLLLTLFLVVFLCKNSVYLFENFKVDRKHYIFTAILFALSLIFLSRESVFIYFNF